MIMRTYRIVSEVFHMASLKENRQMTADDEIPMMQYVISRSISAVKLYSNFMYAHLTYNIHRFIKLFNVEIGQGTLKQKVLDMLELVIT